MDYHWDNYIFVGRAMREFSGNFNASDTFQLEHPEICATYDMNREEAIKTRKYYLQYAKENQLTMAGMHLPPSAFGED